MTTKVDVLEQLYTTVEALRQDSKTRRRYPNEFWNALADLAKTRPVKEICKRLGLNEGYVRNRIKPPTTSQLDFREIPHRPFQETVTIELSGVANLNVRIHGPMTCISFLHDLLRK